MDGSACTRAAYGPFGRGGTWVAVGRWHAYGRG